MILFKRHQKGEFFCDKNNSLYFNLDENIFECSMIYLQNPFKVVERQEDNILLYYARFGESIYTLNNRITGHNELIELNNDFHNIGTLFNNEINVE